MVRFLSAVCIVLLGAQGAAAAFPKEVRIYDFSTTHSWDRFRLNRLRIVDATPVRFETIDSDTELNFDLKSLKEGFKPASRLPALERRALLTMLGNGYISKQLYDEVQKLPPKVGPRQVLYFQVCSILSLAEAKSTFDKIPWERVTGELPQSDAPFNADDVFLRERLWPPDKPLCISEASVMMVRGQENDPFTATHFPAALPWQLSASEALGNLPPLESFLSVSQIDRARHALVWEMKRAHAEGEGPIRGNLSLALLPALRMAWDEARIYGAEARDSLVFIETLSVRIRKHFTRLFGMALWGDQPETAERAVSFVSLDALNRKFGLENLSERDTWLASLSGGVLDPKGAREFLEFAHLSHFVSFRVPPQRGPLHVWDRTPPVFAALAGKVSELGVRRDKTANEMLDYLQSLGSHFLWANSETWFSETGVIISQNEPQPGEWKGLHIRLDNLDPTAVREGGTPFLAKVVLKIYRTYLDRYLHSSAVVQYNWQSMFDQFGIAEKATPESLLRHFPIGVVSRCADTTKDLVSLGGQAVPAWDSLRMALSFGTAGKSEYSVVTFLPAAIERLKERFSEGLFQENACVADLERLSRLQFSGFF